ncbi:VWA domain-containing protein [Lacibacterium aquatile]|uniref:VWA domain-containing protein n=1 Tax=Lacibacterium aquatile TaxID=1168082 RepID=A0ABW5DQF1_9PROT
MFIGFFYALREAGIPATATELLTLIEAVKQKAADWTLDDFYHLSRASLVKDERMIDRFDRVFASYYSCIASGELTPQTIPDEWLRKMAEKYLSPEEMAEIQALGDFDAIIETLRHRLEEQKGRHQGGSKWIGTAGTSPFGAYGYNPAGVRIGQEESRNRRAVKIWDKREFKDLDSNVELGTRTLKLALRRLRRFARTGAASELDLPGTIDATAAKGGLLDIKMRPERHNAVKVLLLLDIGGSMDDHVRLASELFSAAKAEFKHFESFYFHNCVYEKVWRDNARRQQSALSTAELIRTYSSDWRLVFVGDASMSPYELVSPGGSVEHWNEEPGEVWLKRLITHFRRAAWLNPGKERFWPYTPSIEMIHGLMGGRMYPVTLQGVDDAMRDLIH